MNVLELFGGSCSFSNMAKKQGHKTFTSDYKDFDGIDYVTDIMQFDLNKIPFKTDIKIGRARVGKGFVTIS